jgi:hypothetical protein
MAYGVLSGFSGYPANKTLQMTQQKNRLFYPLVIGAVISVTTFSCLGVAAITGHLPVGDRALDPIFASAHSSPSSAAAAPTPVGPRHVGLTRQSGTDPVPASRPFGFRPGQRITQSACPTCGVIHSIEPGAARSALAAANNAGGHVPAAALVIGAIHSEDGTSQAGAQVASFVVRVKMEDGTVRTIYEIQRPRFSVGERVRLINGSIVSQS